MIYQINIKSYIDVITNSSSECFQIKVPKNETSESIKEMLTNFHEDSARMCPDDYREKLPRSEWNKFDSGSGLAGMFDIYTWSNGFENYKKENNLSDDFTPEEWAEKLGKSLEELQSIMFIDTDWANFASIEFIRDMFHVFGEMEGDDERFDYDLWDLYSDRYC